MLKSLCFSGTFIPLYQTGQRMFILVYGSTSENRLETIFDFTEKMLRQICFKARCYASADFFNELNALYVYD